ncbi:hypothetical protein DA456_01210 [Pseudomonas syringae pv. atrofaciens]|uniref:Uncharacterized protein n=1 Tax=Pseudomonas syringae pv. atrofaciens TaxID=192087 RepID=A0AAD0I4R7_PSESX|nr:hypothetical protein DA456_01210 [Pseudomonas syringae pv. atrofaciens]
MTIVPALRVGMQLWTLCVLFVALRTQDRVRRQAIQLTGKHCSTSEVHTATPGSMTWSLKS